MNIKRFAVGFVSAMLCVGYAATANAEVSCGRYPLRSQGLDTPVRANFKSNRHQYVRGAIGRLLRGEDLQVVALGDSIVGDTFGPQYAGTGYRLGTAWGVMPLADFYETPVYAVVSVLGSTGAWYYRKPGNVQKYVLIAQPDLVFIGGISNRDDLDAIRDVVGQIRAANSRTEVVLMTGAVNLQAVPSESTLLLSESADTYEARLARLADELRTGFIDMRGSYNEFVIESNRSNPTIDHSHFQRDPIHANDRGREVLREIATMFFRPAIECTDGNAARSRVTDPPAMVLSLAGELSRPEPLLMDEEVGTVAAGGGSYVKSDVVADQAAADIDRDGVADRLTLLIGESGDTDRAIISMGSESSHQSSITLPLNAYGARRVFFADVNGDAWPDLIVGTDAAVPHVHVYLNSGIDGHWFFDPILLPKGGLAACSVAMAVVDMNADGNGDLLIANGCVGDSAYVDYYQIQVDGLPLNRVAPESIPVNMSIDDVSTSHPSVADREPTLFIYGSADGKTVTKTLRPSRIGANDDSLQQPRGAGAWAWEWLVLVVLLGVTRAMSAGARSKA